MDNKGNRYRVNNALVGAFFLVGIAAAILCYFTKLLDIVPSIGIFVAICGAGVLQMSLAYSAAPVKFGPSEQDFRLAAGIIMLLLGVIMILFQLGMAWYFYVAAALIIIAVVGAAMAVRNGKRMGDE